MFLNTLFFPPCPQILVCGAELYTSLCAYMTAAWWEGKVRARDCVRMWVSSWLWNFVGCAIFVGLMYASGIYKHKDW
jgi:formate/nitrite transporter FocA (FNT family)